MFTTGLSFLVSVTGLSVLIVLAAPLSVRSDDTCPSRVLSELIVPLILSPVVLFMLAASDDLTPLSELYEVF